MSKDKHSKQPAKAEEKAEAETAPVAMSQETEKRLADAALELEQAKEEIGQLKMKLEDASKPDAGVLAQLRRAEMVPSLIPLLKSIHDQTDKRPATTDGGRLGLPVFIEEHHYANLGEVIAMLEKSA